jgi:hypothetical protein
VRNQLSSLKWVNVMLSQHREDANWGVQYSEGFLAPGSGTTMTGSATEYFSIRRNPTLPFTGDAERLTWSMDDKGVLRVHNDSWNFDFDPIDFTCKGNIMTVYQPGSVFSLTFGAFFTPIQ